MKSKLLSLIRAWQNRGEKDVFKSTQNRLTLLYSGLLMLFLVLFIVIVYSLLYTVILKDQERELEEMAAQEARIFENYLVQNNYRSLQGIQNQELVLAGVDQFFYYVVNPKGELIMGDEKVPELRPGLFNLLGGWIPQQKEIRQETLHATYSEWRPKGKGMDDKLRSPVKHHEIQLMIAGRPIFYKGQFIGMLYIGKDISFAYQLFKMLLLILVGLAILFSGVALYLSHLMSKKAMVPITRAFTRQREFVADASHELRTPLSVMLSSIDAMEMTVDTEEDDFSRKLLVNMRNEVKRMAKLVGDLLTLARSDSGTIERVNETFDFRPPAEKAIQSVEPLAAAKQIKLHLSTPEAMVVNGDPERLTQLLYILLDNGIKYTPNGGDVYLALSVESYEHCPVMCIQVKDTGIGIKPEDHARIFDRFYRSDKARTRQMGGHGLGLSIAKWIVENHGGTIQVSSEIGKGSIFTIRIPFSPNIKKA